jgi:hypothetical protein
MSEFGAEAGGMEQDAWVTAGLGDDPGPQAVVEAAIGLVEELLRITRGECPEGEGAHALVLAEAWHRRILDRRQADDELQAICGERLQHVGIDAVGLGILDDDDAFALGWLEREQILAAHRPRVECHDRLARAVGSRFEHEARLAHPLRSRHHDRAYLRVVDGRLCLGEERLPADERELRYALLLACVPSAGFLPGTERIGREERRSQMGLVVEHRGELGRADDLDTNHVGLVVSCEDSVPEPPLLAVRDIDVGERHIQIGAPTRVLAQVLQCALQVRRQLADNRATITGGAVAQLVLMGDPARPEQCRRCGVGG